MTAPDAVELSRQQAPKILVVDDEEDVVTFIKRALTMEGMEVITAFDGLSALDTALEQEPDLIILDIMMPIMNGYEVCARLRLEDKTKNIPIILLSSAYTTDTVRQAKVAGGSGYVAKPFTPAELVGEIRKLLPQNV
jgi:DNA-binding response OmpR family regulator